MVAVCRGTTCLERSAAGGVAARRTLDIMQKEQPNDRIDLKRATGSILEHYGISVADAKVGVMEASHP